MDAPVRGSESTGSAQSGTASSASQVTVFIDLLVTAGYIDGAFDPREQRFVHQYIESVLLQIEQSAPEAERASLRAGWQAHFIDLYRRLDGEIAGLAAAGQADYGTSDLRTRALSLFGALPAHDQKTALEMLHALIHADGVLAPAEQWLYHELSTAFAPAPPPAATQRLPAVESPSPSLIVSAPVQYELNSVSHPLLEPIEQTYSPHPVERKAQIDCDYRLVRAAVDQWARMRRQGTGQLTGVERVTQLPAGARFLDGRVHVMKPNQPVDVIVLGDLHGCYSCLKGALLQSNFIQRVWAHQWDPQQYPDVKLVLLGDYIDRGLFSFDGVLRAALHLFVSMPDHVVLLRGNHEYFRWSGDRIISGVYPAEALASIEPHVPIEMLDTYRLMFEHMPTSMICDRTLLVHGGIPRDDTFAERFRDLGSLNDAEIRFQMMWSDPGRDQHVPVEMQRQNPRFYFGLEQFRAFMDRLELQTIIRGHEKVDSGFQVFYDLGDKKLITLFSAGGRDNCDLPPDSSYRSVTPMALTLRYGTGEAPIAYPWPIQYQAFNYPPHNGFYRPRPVLEFRFA